MPDNIYTLILDAAPYLKGAHVAAGGNKLLDDAFKTSTQGALVFNSKMEVIQKTLKSVTSSGEIMTKTVKRIGDDWYIASTKMTQGLGAAKKAAEALAAAEAAAQGRSATRGIASGQAAVGIVGKTPLPTGGSSNELLAYNRALAGLQKFTQENVTSAARVQKVWTDVNNNVFSANPKYQALQNQLVKVKNAIADIGAESRRAKESSDNYFLSWRNIMRFFEARLLYNGVSDLVGAVKAGTSRAIEFEQVLGRITTLAPTLAGGYKEWGESVKRVATTFGVDATDAAKSYYSALSNQIGNSIQEIESFTRTTAEFARVTGSTAEQANNLFSSAINAFGKSAGEANDIAAKFFKTIDLGRVTAAGLSGSFGRTAVAASTLGVKYEELLASLSTLSRQGVTDADAQTQTLNLFNKLIKPTEKLKEMLQEWGYESGQALVANEGLVGVLRRLDKELQANGVARLGELINDIRGLRGTFGLTGKGLQEFNHDLELIRNSTDDYRKAVELTADTTGQKWAKQLNEVKIAFTSLGQNALGVLVPISDFIGGLVNGIKILISSVIILATHMYGLRIAIPVINFIRDAWAGVTLAAKHATYAIELAKAAATFGISLAIGAIISYFALAENAAKRGKRVYAEAQEATREATKNALEYITKGYDRLARSIEDSFKPGLDSIALTRRAYVRTLAEIDDGFKDLKKTLKSFEDETFRQLDDRISDITSSLSSLRSETKTLEAELSKAFNADELANFRDTLDDLTAGKKARAVEAKIKAALQEATGLARLSLTKTDGAERAKLIKQSREKKDIAESLATDLKALARESIKDKEAADRDAEKYTKKNVARERTQLKLQQEIKTLENEKRANAGKLKDESREDANRRQLLYASQIAEKQEELNRYEEEGRKARELVKVTTRDIYEYNKGIVDLEKERVALINAQLDVTRLMTKEKQAEQESLKKTKEGLTNIFEEISDLMTSKDTGLTSEQTIKKVETLRNEYKKLVNVASDPAAFQQLLQYSDKIVERARAAQGLADNGKLQAKYQNELKESVERVNTLKGKDLKLTEQIRDTINKTQGELAAIPSFSFNLSGVTDEEGEAYIKMRDELDAIIARVRETPDALDSNLPRLKELKDQLNTFRLDNAEAMSEASIKNIENISLLITSLSRSSKELSGVRTEQDKLIAMQPVLQKALNDPLTTAAESAKTLTERMQESAQEINASADAMARMRGIISAEDKATPINVGKAGGGMMRFAGGGQPYGSDKIPAMLSPGEFVVNAGASRKFYSQLVAMNSGSRNYAGGGNVNTSVGDVNISMSSSGNAATDVVRIGKLLRREIRRGTVKL